MNKKEMINRMKDICFKVQGVSLQLGAGHVLRAAAAATNEERGKHLDAARGTAIPAGALATLSGIIAAIHPEHLEVDELPEPFDKLENMSEEEIGEWIVTEIKNGKEMTEKK